MAAQSTYAAVLELLNEEANMRVSNTAGRRILRACKTLKFSAAETALMFTHLGYCNSDGEPFARDIKAVWKDQPPTNERNHP